MPWNLQQRYDNDRAKWMTELRARHREWGFTFLAPSIGGAAIDPAKLGDNPPKALLNSGSGNALGRVAPD
jgi:hypothetical protein